jgi:hypothetical protein
MSEMSRAVCASQEVRHCVSIESRYEASSAPLRPMVVLHQVVPSGAHLEGKMHCFLFLSM